MSLALFLRLATLRRAALALACAALPMLAMAAVDAAPATVTVPSCAWDRPGHNPFMGDVVAAVDRYRDIPVDVRSQLKARMARREYDDIVSIRRDSITGKAEYGSTISDMHFGTHQLCRSVTRAAWTPAMQERGLVYCEGRHCILVPTVCRNVSRISRAAVSPAHAEAPDDADPIPAVPLAAAPPLTTPIDGLAAPLAIDNAPSFASAQPAPGGYGGGGGGGAPGPVGLWGPAGPLMFASAPPGGDSVPPPAPPGAAPMPPVTTPVPEPQTWVLMAAGIAALAAWRRRRCGSWRR
jgi:hypothetical protein